DDFACGRLQVDVAAEVGSGLARGCEQAGAAPIGGETAEMAGMCREGDADLAEVCVGAVERRELTDGGCTAAGDTIIGIASSGPHSNGYSLIRRVLETAGSREIAGEAAESVLLTPTRIYVKPILTLMQKVTIKGLAHITGGGITENLPRILQPGLRAEIDLGSWAQGPVFDWLAANGQIAPDEMRRTFNCGVGMIAVVAPPDADTAIRSLEESGESAWRLGRVAAGGHGVHYI